MFSSSLEANRSDEIKFVNEFQTYMQDGQYIKAVTLAKKIITYTEAKSFSEEREITLSGMYLKLSELYLRLHQKEKALFWLEKLSKVENRYIYPTHKQYLLKLYSTLAEKALLKASYERAALFKKKAFELSSELCGKNAQSTVVIGLSLGSMYYELGKYKKAYEVSKSSYETLKLSLKPDDVELSKVALNIGTYLMAMGYYNKALSYQLSALKSAQKSVGRDKHMIASMYNTIALTYIRQGNYPQAESYLKRAIEIKIKDRQSDTSLIKIYSHLAMIYQELGNQKRALEFYGKAIALFTQLGLDDQSLQTTIYANMAQAYMDTGELEPTKKYYHKALNLSDKNHINTSYIYSNLGLLHTVLKQYDKAEGFLKQALDLKTKYLGSSHQSLVYTYLNLASLYEEKHSFQKALASEMKALELLKKNGNNQEDLLQRTYSSMANTYKSLGYLSKAYTMIDHSIASFLKLKDSAYSMTSQKEKHYFKDSYKNLLNNYFSISYAYIEILQPAQKEAMIQSVFSNWIEIKRSIFEVSDQFRILALKSKDKNVKHEVTQLLENQRNLAQLNQKSVSSADADNKRNVQIVTLKDAIEKSEKFLSRKLKEVNMILPTAHIDFLALSEKFGKETLYIDFAKIERYYYALTMDEHHAFSFVRFDKNETVALETKIKEIHEEVKKITNKENFADIKLVYAQYETLYDIFTKKIDISDKKSLIISPDGLMNLLPFEALYDQKTHRFLIENVDVQYVSSAKDLALIPSDEKPRKGDIVIFANPNYDANVSQNEDIVRGSIIESLPAHFYALPGTKKEALDIKNIFPESRLYLEENATEEHLLEIYSPQILHIATHGFFLKQFSEFSALMKNGIVLNGANSAIENKHGEGIVTGLELAGLSLQYTELVVLSSCYSGLGDIVNGEGMIGLGDAFKKAGAQNVLTSLWAVNDDLGVKMMNVFYQDIKSYGSYGNALRKAKLSLIKEGIVHPYYWANFVLYGSVK